MGTSAAEEEFIAEASWKRAREFAAELGEAHAALARRRAQEEHGGGDNVVTALQELLQDAEEREALSCAELAAACDRLAASQAEQHHLRRRANDASRKKYDERGKGSLATTSRLDALENEVASLEDESRARSKMLAIAEAQLAELQRG